MPRLCESDYREALAVLREAGAVVGPDPFPEPVLEALRQLVPCDVVAYHEGRPISHPALVFAGEPRGEMTPSIRDAHEHYLSEDPLTPVDGARKYSDYFSQRQFHRLGLYREVARPVGVQDMIRLWLDPRSAGNARLEFDRADWGFRERDRAVLDLLLPHLKQFRRHAAARRRLSARAANAVERLTPREREILELVAKGRTNAEVARLLWISPGTVRGLLAARLESKLGRCQARKSLRWTWAAPMSRCWSRGVGGDDGSPPGRSSPRGRWPSALPS